MFRQISIIIQLSYLVITVVHTIFVQLSWYIDAPRFIRVILLHKRTSGSCFNTSHWEARNFFSCHGLFQDSRFLAMILNFVFFFFFLRENFRQTFSYFGWFAKCGGDLTYHTIQVSYQLLDKGSLQNHSRHLRRPSAGAVVPLISVRIHLHCCQWCKRDGI